jgi:hypothetical protein
LFKKNDIKLTFALDILRYIKMKKKEKKVKIDLSEEEFQPNFETSKMRNSDPRPNRCKKGGIGKL